MRFLDKTVSAMSSSPPALGVQPHRYHLHPFLKLLAKSHALPRVGFENRPTGGSRTSVTSAYVGKVWAASIQALKWPWASAK